MLCIPMRCKSEIEFDGERRPKDSGLKITGHFPVNIFHPRCILAHVVIHKIAFP
jgi:hypothetical protein